MLTDEEVATIRRKLAEGWRAPVLLKGLEELLADRDELLARLAALESARDAQGGAGSPDARNPALGRLPGTRGVKSTPHFDSAHASRIPLDSAAARW